MPFLPHWARTPRRTLTGISLALTAMGLALAAPVSAGPGAIRVDCRRGGLLQDAIDGITTTSATIKVTGTCTGHFSVPGASATLTNLTLTGGHGAVLDGGSSGSVLVVTGAATTLTISSLAIQNGSSYSGGGIDNEGGTLTLTSVTLSGNVATYAGGGVFSLGSLSLNKTVVSSNTSAFGGGIFVYSGITNILSSSFTGNVAGSKGGGVWETNTGAVTIGGSAFTANSAGSQGGGVLDTGRGPLTLTNDTFLSNTTGTGGSGGALYSCGNPSVSSTVIFASNSEPQDVGISPSSGRVVMTLAGTAVPTRWVRRV